MVRAGSSTGCFSAICVARKHSLVQNVRLNPLRFAFSTSQRSLVYDVPQPSQTRLTSAASDRQAREQ